MGRPPTLPGVQLYRVEVRPSSNRWTKAKGTVRSVPPDRKGRHVYQFEAAGLVEAMTALERLFEPQDKRPLTGATYLRPLRAAE